MERKSAQCRTWGYRGAGHLAAAGHYSDIDLDILMSEGSGGPLRRAGRGTDAK
jgi:hypothetical protein